MALAHGLGNGTDGTSAWMLTLSAVCALAVAATRHPNARSSWIAIVPMPPEPPCTSASTIG